jgi:hypothetical protein
LESEYKIPSIAPLLHGDNLDAAASEEASRGAEAGRARHDKQQGRGREASRGGVLWKVKIGVCRSGAEEEEEERLFLSAFAIKKRTRRLTSNPTNTRRMPSKPTSTPDTRYNRASFASFARFIRLICPPHSPHLPASFASFARFIRLICPPHPPHLPAS